MKKTIAVLLTASFAAILSSCSVKEDRDDCPCRLSLTVKGGSDGVADLSGWNGKRTVSGTFVVSEGLAEGEFEIPRGAFRLNVCSGRVACVMTGSRLIIPPGEEMDGIFTSTITVDASGEQAEGEVTLHKNFCTLNLLFTGLDKLESLQKAVILSNTCGIDLGNMQPVRGEFRRSIYPLVPGVRKVVVPRQCDDSLSVLFYDEGRDTPRGIVYLGDLISKEGYDWTREDLDDLWIEVDARTAWQDVRIRIVEWETVEI